MSVAAVAWAFEQHLPPNEKVVLLALADCENGQSQVCIPGQERIAQMSSMSVRSVRRMLTALEARGLIEREHRNRGNGRTSDSYVLNRAVRLAGGVEPTGQSGSPNRTTVAGIREPEEEPEDTPPTPSEPTASEKDDAFEGAWAAWPRKVGKEAARRKFMALSDADLATMIPALVQHANAYRTFPDDERQFVPHLSTWLNQRRWQDGEAPRPRTADGKPKPKRIDPREEWRYR
jgi:hypothetical protein